MKNYKETYEISTGDIIYSSNNYFVVGRENKKIKCLLLKSSTKKSNNKFYQNLLENIDFMKEIVFDLDETNLHYLMTLNNNFISCILEKYNSYKKRQQTVERGAIVLVRGQLHYIYSEESQNFIAYTIQNKFSDKLQPVIINGRNYYINFDKEIYISKREGFEIKNLASIEEMSAIKKQKKDYLGKSEKTKISNIRVCKENLTPGVRFKLKNCDDSFVVLKNEGDLIKYINQTYLDVLLNFESHTDMSCIDTILDDDTEIIEKNKQKIKTLIDSYKKRKK